MISITVVSVVLNIWGRWQATRITKRVQLAYRKRVFDHAVRLPLHRVYELKSGGVASILREDAGGVGDLVFSMIYNPSRAVFQLARLAGRSWRSSTGGCCSGAILLLPTVWLTHRRGSTGSARSSATSARRARASTPTPPRRSAASASSARSAAAAPRPARFTGDNHYMARQEIFAWWWMRGIDIAWSLLIPLASAVLLWYGGGKVLADAERVARRHARPARRRSRPATW